MKLRANLRLCAGARICGHASVCLRPLTQVPDRSKPPVPGPAPSLRVPPVQKRTLSNGLPVWIVEMHEVPVVDVTLIVKSGAAADPAGRVRAGKLHGGDARRGRRHAKRARAGRRRGFSRRVAQHRQLVGLVERAPAHPGREARRGAAALGGRRAAARAFPPDRDRASAQGAADLDPADPRQRAGARRRRRSRALVYGPRHRYGTPAMGNEVSNDRDGSVRTEGRSIRPTTSRRTPTCSSSATSRRTAS